MLLSDSHKFAFYHYPKTAGTSITAALAPYLRNPIRVRPTDLLSGWQSAHHVDKLQHSPIRHIGLTPPTDYLTAVFIRNPFEIVVSAWNIDQISFDKFVSEEIETRQHPTLQYTILDSIVDVAGNLPNFIGRHENMDKDWKKFCKLVGLPKLRLPYRNIKELKWNRQKNPDYRTHYTHYSREVVERVFGNDLHYFGYSLDK
jgi:hypothetical protein